MYSKYIMHAAVRRDRHEGSGGKKNVRLRKTLIPSLLLLRVSVCLYRSKPSPYTHKKAPVFLHAYLLLFATLQ